MCSLTARAWCHPFLCDDGDVDLGRSARSFRRNFTRLTRLFALLLGYLATGPVGRFHKLTDVGVGVGVSPRTFGHVGRPRGTDGKPRGKSCTKDGCTNANDLDEAPTQAS